MPISDIQSVILWWSTFFIIGLSVFPVTRIIFHKFIDQGYIFSKVLGIFLLSYSIWLLGVVKIVPFYQESIIILLLIIGAINILIAKKWKLKDPPENKTILVSFIVIEELLFLATLTFWSYIRAHEPSIRGLEKFMDFGFIESILRGTYFPPLDMWLTKSPDYEGGYFINYYYFGHLVAAVLTKLSTIPSLITYNLMIATTFAFTFCLSFSLGVNIVFNFIKTNIKYAIIGGFLAAFLVSLGGNLHTIYSLTTGYPNENPAPFWQLDKGWHPETYWYPNATRFIPYTIHEFPIYSFVVADLHGHVSDIPFVLLTLALLFNLILKSGSDLKETKGLTPLRNFFHEFHSRTSVSLPYLFLLGSLVAVMYMTNALDGLIYLVLTAAILLYLNWHKTHTVIATLTKTFSASLFLLFFFLIASLPFSYFFRPFGTGIGVLCAPDFLIGKNLGPVLFEEGKCQKSDFWMLTILWGFFYYNIIGYLLLIVIPGLKRKISFLHAADIFVITTTIISTLLLIFPEFFYVKDIYPAHYRANTMFKLGYQAFMMLGLNSAYIFIRITKIKFGISKTIYLSGFAVVFFLVGIYPFFAINSYYGGLTTYRGLDGLQWMKQEYLQDYEAVVWLKQNVFGQSVILEANGESYTDYARISANTGLPTVIGWPVHEWLWRGSYDEAGKRIPEVQMMYESPDLNQTKELLNKYNVEYVFIGTLERQKYPNLVENKWETLGEQVFESGNTVIYKVML
ncbi:hypothetical protein HYW54_04355 [Candidatus Gottesmanbacteria bacterium]|nr:hypothetical protein [Candidatus Gottesmanbacteria bacterium]